MSTDCIDQIKPDMWIEEILERFPQAQHFLSEQGIVCIMCGEPVWGSLTEQMEEKGFDSAKQKTIIEELNKYILRGDKHA